MCTCKIQIKHYPARDLLGKKSICVNCAKMIGGRDQHVPSGHTPPRAVFGAAAFEKAPRVNVAPFNPVEMSEVSDAPPKALSDCCRCCMTRPPKFGPFSEQRVLSPLLNARK